MAQVPIIAIIDDDELVRSAMASLIRSLGLSMRIFGSAEEYLAASTDDICCVISDMDMPGITGMQLLQRIIASGSHLPVIIMTAIADKAIEARAMAAGAACFLTKPVDVDRLIAHLETLVGKFGA